MTVTMAKQYLVFLLIMFVHLIPTTKTSTGCEAEFAGRCACGIKLYEGVRKFVTNCTNSGFNNTSALEQLAPETEVLIFTGNNISMLPPNIFGDVTTYKNLEVIDLSNNSISRIQGKAFHRIPNVKKLILNNNRWMIDDHRRLFANMESLEELYLNSALDIGAPPYIDPTETSLYERSIHKLINMFTENPLTNLKVIHLESNDIGPNLDMEIFCSLPMISRIYLANNSILRVNWNSSCLHSLMNLNLSSNHIRHLSNDTLYNFEEIPNFTLDLRDNNFNCDCHLEDFYHWLHDTKVFVVGKENYKCEDGFPEDNTGEFILSLPPRRLWCVPLLLSPGFGVAHAILLIVVSLMILLLTLVAIMNRRIISLTVRRFGEPLYRRLQYSSIQKQMVDREIEM